MMVRTSARSRQPKGIPSGGEFAKETKQEQSLNSMDPTSLLAGGREPSTTYVIIGGGGEEKSATMTRSEFEARNDLYTVENVMPRIMRHAAQQAQKLGMRSPGSVLSGGSISGGHKAAEDAAQMGAEHILSRLHRDEQKYACLKPVLHDGYLRLVANKFVNDHRRDSTLLPTSVATARRNASRLMAERSEELGRDLTDRERHQCLIDGRNEINPKKRPPLEELMFYSRYHSSLDYSSTASEEGSDRQFDLSHQDLAARGSLGQFSAGEIGDRGAQSTSSTMSADEAMYRMSVSSKSDPSEKALKMSKTDVKAGAYNIVANAFGLPEVRSESIPGKDIQVIRRSVSDYPGGVSGVAGDYLEGIESEATDRFFRPFGVGISGQERRDIAETFAPGGQLYDYAEETYESVLTTASATTAHRDLSTRLAI